MTEEKTETTQEIEQPKETLIQQISKADPEQLKKVFSILSMLIRAFEGKDPADKDVITRLINLNSQMERSRFPSMPIINFQVYCRLLAHYYPEECEAFGKWADLQAEALIAYQGLNWDAYVDMVKAQYGAQPTPQTAISFGTQQAQVQQQQQKKHWWSRAPKQDQRTGEFRKD